MSKEILKALMQLFALIAKQDEGVNKSSDERKFVIQFLNSQLSQEAAKDYIELFDNYAGLSDDAQNNNENNEKKLTSVLDSVRIIGICKKINKTLNAEQKVIVLVRLYEMVNANGKFTKQRMDIIDTVAKVFKLSQEEIHNIRDFIIEKEHEKLDISNEILIVNDKETSYQNSKHIQTEELDGSIVILHVPSVDLYFLKYTGEEELYLNGLGLNNKAIYLFASGGTIKLPKGKPIYYSDITSRFLEDYAESKISYHCSNVNYVFPNGNMGVRDVNFSENHGKLIGIMGVSGAGKTTLLNLLCGLEKPSSGEVLINGINLHEDPKKIEGVIGLVPQDDLLIEELTIFQNLYYNAKLCFKDLSDEEIVERVDKTLENLGLLDYKDLKVGSPIKKVISGGQRKRLNIALELIREPAIMFVDEPTTGLSSRDSENVMDLLRELSLKGKLIFVVIHQPSSEIYKMFDNMMIMDVGGHMIYYGNPIEAVMYFKQMDAQINSDVGECPTCGNVNPELIFNIIEAKVVDEFGKYTDERKVTPDKWEEKFKENVPQQDQPVVHESTPKSLRIPGWFKQVRFYAIRDFLSKISNRQYIILNLLEAPVLGFILSFIVRYTSDPESGIYVFRDNENISRFIFMALIVALFLGLTVSAEEIFRDRKLLKREKFLNLSRSSYLVSKISILFLLSAIQTFTFVIIANNILEINGLTYSYWIALFSTAAFANMLGLNISASFNSVVTIYIMIPLVMIPMMILSGAMFEFDKLNKTISSVGKVPVIAELMPTKWSYEALMTKQFKDNKFEKQFYDVEKQISIGDFHKVYYIPKLKEALNECRGALETNDKTEIIKDNLALIKNELTRQMAVVPGINFKGLDEISTSNVNMDLIGQMELHLDKLNAYYNRLFQKANEREEKMIKYLLNKDKNLYTHVKNKYYNEDVAEIVKQVFEENKIIKYKNRLYQKIDPIFNTPIPSHFLDFRAHFYAPEKYFMGRYIDTFTFNVAFIWFFTVLLYISLYYGLFGKALNSLSSIGGFFQRNKSA